MYECDTCSETFWDEYDCDEHMDDYGHHASCYDCLTCNRNFRTVNARNQHMNDTDHWPPVFTCESSRCNREFSSQNAANQHMTATQHWKPRIPCQSCTMVFTDNDAADRHMRQAAHYANYCQDCDQVFQSENNLRMHLNSSIHRGRSISCPFCSIKYTTASGLSHHLETGSCPRAPQLNRQTILQLIRKRDPHGAITIRQLEWYPEAQVTYSATDRAFNGSDWECYLCHKLFGGVRALEQHLNSPAHQQRVYHCPKRACGKEFITLAGLFSHLESESCGYIRFEKVQQQVGAVFSSNRMIAFV